MIVRLVAARVSTWRIRGVVVNFDLPLVAEDYKHRVDRTARAGQHGPRAVSLLSASEIVCCGRFSELVPAPLEPVPVPKARRKQADDQFAAVRVRPQVPFRPWLAERHRHGGARGYRTDGRRAIIADRLSAL